MAHSKCAFIAITLSNAFALSYSRQHSCLHKHLLRVATKEAFFDLFVRGCHIVKAVSADRISVEASGQKRGGLYMKQTAFIFHFQGIEIHS